MEISWNLIGPPGNFCVRCRRSTALVSSRIKLGTYQITYLKNWSPYFIYFTSDEHWLEIIITMLH